MTCRTAEPGSLLDGTFDEIANRRAFLQALYEWRNGGGAPAGGLEGEEENEQRGGEEEQEQSEEEKESISCPSHEHQDEEEETAEEATATVATAAKERVDEALKSFAAMGDWVDLSKEGRADEQCRVNSARQKVWTDLDEALTHHSRVYRLDLSRQRLKTLPKDIGTLNKVESICLRENDLTEDSLPEEFFDLGRLKEIDISYNRFKALPSCMCTFLDLETINIAGNDFADPRDQARKINVIFPDCKVIYC